MLNPPHSLKSEMPFQMIFSERSMMSAFADGWPTHGKDLGQYSKHCWQLFLRSSSGEASDFHLVLCTWPGVAC